MVEFKDVARAALDAVERRERIALATLIRVRGSSPRHVGARMLIWPDGRIIGTIGGGTLEWRVVEHAQEALAQGESRYSNYVFDSRGGPESVGLCGGSVDVHIDVDVPAFAPTASAALSALERGERVALVTVVRDAAFVTSGLNAHLLVWPDGRTFGALGSQALEASAVAGAQSALAEHQSRYLHLSLNGAQAEPHEVVLHVDTLIPDPVLLIIGAGHVAQPIAAMGKMLGMRVCVVDDRADWANRERFPTADEIAVIGYEPVNEVLAPIPFPMTPATSVIVTTWGYDLPAMQQALEQSPGYIGLVASPTKARVLFQRLRQAGYADEAIQRIRAPIGLDVGAESPAEIAISVLAEILATARGRTGQPLATVRGQKVQALFSRPPMTKVGKEIWQPAIAFAGAIGASAFSTTSATACCVRCRQETAAGSFGLRIVASGMTILTGRLQPSFCGNSGVNVTLTA